MFESEKALQTAVSAFRPSASVRAAVKKRIRSSGNRISVVFVSQNSEKILKSVFARHEKLLKKIA